MYPMGACRIGMSTPSSRVTRFTKVMEATLNERS
jgi:hypothetical protein